MEKGLVYKSFFRDKTLEELRYYTSLWVSEFNFINHELTFIKRLIKAYPFSATIPNMYERLQLFILELDNFEKEKNSIAKKISDYHLKISEKSEINTLESGHFYLLEYEKLAEEVFMYIKHYKNLKIQIFEYINGLID